MPQQEILFYGAPAYVGRVDQFPIVHFWCIGELVPPPPPASKLIAVNFERMLSPRNWDADLDCHRVDGGLTSIGPEFPGGASHGAVYCIKSIWDECLSKGLWEPPSGDKVYQYQCVARSPSAGAAIARFHGFRAKVVRVFSPGRVVLLDIYEANNAKAQWSLFVDLDDSTTCLPTGDFTRIDTTSTEPDAIFFTSSFIIREQLRIPKLPPAFGIESWPIEHEEQWSDPRASARERRSLVLLEPRQLRRAAPKAVEAPPPPINIISTGTDWELETVRGVVKGEPPPARGARGVRSTLQTISRSNSRPDQTLDFIGHSVGTQCHLRIGDWTIEQSSDLDTFLRLRVRPMLRKLDVRRVRLLGCATATTCGGWATMQSIARSLDGVEVFGTNRVIYARNFDEQGLTVSNVLHSHTRADKATLRLDRQQDARVDAPLVPELLDQTNISALSETRWPQRIGNTDELNGIWKFIETTEAWSFPGLLAEPLVELLVPAEDESVHRLQVLLNYQLVRVFPRDGDRHGVVYRVKEPTALAELAALMPVLSMF